MFHFKPLYSPGFAHFAYLFRLLQCYLQGKQLITFGKIKSDIEYFFISKFEEFYARGTGKLPYK